MKFPDLEDERLAELIGIILGDGSIGLYYSTTNGKVSVQRRLKISFHSEDLEYIAFVKTLLIELFDIEPIIKTRKNEQTTNIFLFRKHVIEFLLNLGLVKAPKWDRAIIPEKFMRLDLATKILRGYFDTDGSVVLANNNGIVYPRLEFKISPSPMQKQLIKILKKMNAFRFGVYNIGKGKVRIQLNGKEQLQNWLELVGFSNSKHLKKVEKWSRSGSRI